MQSKEIDLIRDVALSIEDINLVAAYNLLCLAQKYRPNGPQIKEKIKAYLKELQVDNGPVNIHLGVHKTATTYIQQNLEQIVDPTFHYTKLNEFRLFIKRHGYIKYLKSLDFTQQVVISDENLIGGNKTALKGSLYLNLSSNVNNLLLPLKNRELLKIYIPMTTFLPSQYCEYLRHNTYIPYDRFIKKMNIATLSWSDILNETMLSNDDISFTIFNFENFSTSKDKLLKELSFGLKTQCDATIKPSRVSLTYRELSQMSNGALTNLSDSKFDPHTKEEKEASMINYQSDLLKLSQYKNVTLLQ